MSNAVTDPAHAQMEALRDAHDAVAEAARLIHSQWEDRDPAHPLPARTARMLDEIALRLEAEIRLLVFSARMPDLDQEAADQARAERTIRNARDRRLFRSGRLNWQPPDGGAA